MKMSIEAAQSWFYAGMISGIPGLAFIKWTVVLDGHAQTILSVAGAAFILLFFPVKWFKLGIAASVIIAGFLAIFQF